VRFLKELGLNLCILNLYNILIEPEKALYEKKQKTAVREKIFLNMFVKNKKKLTQQEIEYFRMHPSEIDEITAPINVHKVFLTFGIVVGVILVGISKIIKTTNLFDFMQGTFEEFVIDIIFEIGVALIGAGVTAYLLGILMNTQQQNAKKWRKEIRRKIREADQ
jgi:hypothetical protein